MTAQRQTTVAPILYIGGSEGVILSEGLCRRLEFLERFDEGRPSLGWSRGLSNVVLGGLDFRDLVTMYGAISSR